MTRTFTTPPTRAPLCCRLPPWNPPGRRCWRRWHPPSRPSEAITLEPALEAYTLGSARAEFLEDEKGTIAPGKLADLAVLSQDIFTVPVAYLPSTESVLTLVGGEIVHNSGALVVPREWRW